MILKLSLYVETKVPQIESEPMKRSLEELLVRGIRQLQTIELKELESGSNDIFIHNSQTLRKLIMDLKISGTKVITPETVLEKMRKS